MIPFSPNRGCAEVCSISGTTRLWTLFSPSQCCASPSQLTISRFRLIFLQLDMSSTATAQATPSTLCSDYLGIVYDDTTGDAQASAARTSPWRRTDSYPDLPEWTASAASGCTFCGYLCFLVQQRLPVYLADRLRKRPGVDIIVTLDSPAYTRRSQIIEYLPDLTAESYAVGKDGPYWLDLLFECEAWPERWRARGNVHQRDGMFFHDAAESLIPTPTPLCEPKPFCLATDCRGPPDAVSALLGISLRLPAPNVLDQSCIGRLQEWLRVCKEEHPQC